MADQSEVVLARIEERVDLMIDLFKKKGTEDREDLKDTHARI